MKQTVQKGTRLTKISTGERVTVEKTQTVDTVTGSLVCIRPGGRRQTIPVSDLMEIE